MAAAKKDIDVLFRRARLALYRDPATEFWFPLACRLEPVYLTKKDLEQWPGAVPLTLTATDGEYIYVHAEAFENISPEERKGAILHETLHCAFGHIDRRHAREPMLWNIAADIHLHAHCAVLSVALPERYTRSCEEVLRACKLPTDFSQYLNETAEATYNAIAQKTVAIKFCHGCLAPHPKGTKKEHELSQEWQGALEAQVQAGQLAGNVPAGLEEWVKARRVKPRDWRTDFRSELQALTRAVAEWIPPNRRYLWRNMYLPGRTRRNMPTIVWIQDTSGSMSSTTLQESWGEVLAFRDSVPCDFWLVECDYGQPAKETFYPREVALPDAITIHGRGGTDLNPAIHEADKRNPQLIIVATDMEFEIEDRKPNAPVVWLAWSGQKAPYGKTINVKSATPGF